MQDETSEHPRADTKGLEDARYRSVVETTPDMVVIMDSAGIIVSANAACERTLGYREDEIAGQPLTMLMPERFRERHTQGLARYEATGQKRINWASVRLPVLDKDGNEIAANISFGSFEEDGKRFFTGIIRDERVRQKSDQLLSFLVRAGPTLAESSLDYHKTLKTLINLAVPYLADWCSIDLLLPSGRLQRLASADEGPHGGANSEIEASVIEETISRPDHHGVIKVMETGSYIVVPLVAHGHTHGALTLAQGASGRRFEDADMPFIEDLGGRAGLAIHNAALYEEATRANDLLKEQAKEMEIQARGLKEVARNLEEKTKEAEEAQALATEASHAKSAFLATMSHEIRTPINAILGYSQLLEMGLAGDLTSRQKVQMERIHSSTKHLLGLIDEILDLSRAEAGALQVSLAKHPSSDTADMALSLVRASAHTENITLAIAPDPDASFYMGDEHRTCQILGNLLINAMKYSPPGGRVSLAWELVAPRTGTMPSAALSKNASYIRFDVTDEGKGVEPGQIEKIFEPFVQADEGGTPYTRTNTGAGLGLAISRGLARLMGGDVTAISTVGEGSTFSLWLPRAT